MTFCMRCSHVWTPKYSQIEPKACPKCRSRHWDRVATTEEIERMKKRIAAEEKTVRITLERAALPENERSLLKEREIERRRLRTNKK